MGFFIVIVFHGIVDIFFITYLGNEINYKSGRLSYCLFGSNWMVQTESCKKCVLIFGELLKKPEKLVIWIFPMDLQTFTSVSEILANYK